VKFAVK